MRFGNGKISSGIAIFMGFFILLSAYSDNPHLSAIREKTLHWAVMLFAVLFFLGILDFIFSRIKSLGNNNANYVNNLVCVLAFFSVLVFGFAKGFENQSFQKIVFTLQTTVESSLAGLIAIALILAFYRLPKINRGKMKSAFIFSALFFMLAYSDFFSIIELPDFVLKAFRLISALPIGGIYGLLLGLAIGGLITGIRYISLNRYDNGEDKK